MKKNMGTIDRVLRVILAVVVGIFYFTGSISGTAAIVLGVLGGYLPGDRSYRLLPAIRAVRYFYDNEVGKIELAIIKRATFG